MNTIKDLNMEVQEVTFSIDGKVELGLLNLGAITMSYQGREAILDILTTSAVYDEELDVTNFECKVEPIEETIADGTFPDCKYDLTYEDLRMSFNQIYVGTEKEKGNLLSLVSKMSDVHRKGIAVDCAIRLWKAYVSGDYVSFFKLYVLMVSLFKS